MAKRPIFEETSALATRPAAPAKGSVIEGRAGARKAIRVWLWVMFAMVVAMIMLGGMTRLTDSGLSITEWRPVTGALPPMSDVDWQAEFEKYRQSPEFLLQNSQMTLDGFKSIYWWEWGHRQLGRVVGLVWAVGFFGLLIARRMPPGWAGRLLGLGLLGGAQGAIGWWMVSSGLSGRMVDVASYRLAIHLGLAFAILGLIAWYMLSLTRSEAALLQARRLREGALVTWATVLAALTFLQILLGALVAGIDAGRAFPTWPLMGDSFVPADPFYLPDGGPAILALFENPGLVQFDHRMLGYIVVVAALFVWSRGRRSAHAATKAAFDWVAAMAFGQVVLGIVTVLYSAPLHLGLIHQLGAVILWVLILRARHRATYPVVQSVRGRA